MGYHLNRLDEPILSKPLLTEFGVHHRLESCEYFWDFSELVFHTLLGTHPTGGDK